MPGLKRPRYSQTSNDSWTVDEASTQGKRTGMSTAVRAKRAVKSKALRTQVKKIVENLAEKKHATYNQNAGPVSSYNYSGFSNQVIAVSPMSTFLQISQGTAQNQRIGNKIRTSKCTFKGIMWPTVYNATTNPFPAPQNVRFVLFSVKGDTTAFPSSLADFFQNGASSHDPNGDLGDMIDTVNSDLYTVYKDFQVKLGYQQFDTTPGGGGNAGFFANNDFHLNQKIEIDCSKACPAVVQYNDNSSAPTSRAVFLAWFAAAANGSTGSSVSMPANMNYSIDYTYTDD